MSVQAKVIIYLLVLLALAGVGFKARDIIYQAGIDHQKSIDAEAVKKADAVVEDYKRRQKDLLETSKTEMATKIRDVEEAYQKGVLDGKAQVGVIYDSIDNGTAGLSVNVECPSETTTSDASGVAAGTKPGDNATTRARLSKADAKFLTAIAGEADDVTKQLNAAIDIITVYRAQAEQYRQKLIEIYWKQLEDYNRAMGINTSYTNGDSANSITIPSEPPELVAVHRF